MVIAFLRSSGYMQLTMLTLFPAELMMGVEDRKLL